MNAYLAAVQAAAITYRAYKCWNGSPNIRGSNMARAKRDMIAAAILYRYHRRIELMDGRSN